MGVENSQRAAARPLTPGPSPAAGRGEKEFYRGGIAAGIRAADGNAARRAGPLAYGATRAQVPFGGRKKIIDLHS